MEPIELTQTLLNNVISIYFTELYIVTKVTLLAQKSYADQWYCRGYKHEYI